MRFGPFFPLTQKARRRVLQDHGVDRQLRSADRHCNGKAMSQPHCERLERPDQRQDGQLKGGTPPRKVKDTTIFKGDKTRHGTATISHYAWRSDRNRRAASRNEQHWRSSTLYFGSVTDAELASYIARASIDLHAAMVEQDYRDVRSKKPQRQPLQLPLPS